MMVRARDEISRVSGRGLDWVSFSAGVDHTVQRLFQFDACCWHTVDPGTILFTGSANRNIACSGSWLAHYEYEVEDVNKWAFLAHSGRIAGATSIDTHGKPHSSARFRSHESIGIEDELRVSLVDDGIYWGAAGFLREAGRPPFTAADVSTLAALAAPLAAGLRRAMITQPAPGSSSPNCGPGVVVFDASGNEVSISPAAERWIDDMIEIPAPTTRSESKIVRSIAARARAIPLGTDPLELNARARVRTHSGAWLLLYGTRLSGEETGRVAVIIQPAAPPEVADIVSLAYGLTPREREVTMLCVQGRSTQYMAHRMHLSPYTVQDHLKSIYAKTGVCSRGALVGRVFLEHYAPRWEAFPDFDDGWHGFAT